MLSFIENLTEQAGDILLSHFRQDEELLLKRTSAKEAVTEYDKMVDSFIIQEIRRKYPESSLLTEESGYLKGDPDWLWVVDSLDGTGNFSDSNPLFTVCIAVMYKKELVTSAVYAPAIGELYLAEKGSGSYLSGRKINVTEISELRQSYLLYCEGGTKDRRKTGKLLAKVYPEVMDIRKLGSAGLETAWVAAGKSDGYYTTDIELWDVAAGVLLIREAGGEVTDFEGNPWKPEKGDFLFSNGKLHAALLGLLKQV